MCVWKFIKELFLCPWRDEQRQKDMKKLWSTCSLPTSLTLTLSRKHLLGGSARDCDSLPRDIVAHGLWTCTGFRSIQGALHSVCPWSNSRNFLTLHHFSHPSWDNFCPQTPYFLALLAWYWWAFCSPGIVNLGLQLTEPSAPEPEETMWVWNLDKKNYPV